MQKRAWSTLGAFALVALATAYGCGGDDSKSNVTNDGGADATADTGDDAKRTWLRETTGRRTVPQIFIGGEAIGGFDALAALDQSGKLAEMLQAS